MTGFDIGLSALRTSQYALNVISNNISNANTEGFHRRKVHTEALAPQLLGGYRVGRGVQINDIERVRDQVAEVTLTNAVSDASHIQQLLTIERQIETAFLSSDSSIGEQLNQFFGEITKLTAAPDEPAQRTAVIEAGERMAGTIRHGAQRMSELSDVIKFQIAQEVESLNYDMRLLSDLTTRVNHLSAQNANASAELDERDALLNKIAAVIDVRRTDFLSGDLHLMIGDASIEQGGTANQFDVLELEDNKIGIKLDDSDRPIGLRGGRLAALVELYNSTIPKYADKLDEVAAGVMRQIDHAHAVGVGTAGSFQHLIATRAVQPSQTPIATTKTVFPVAAGDVTLSIEQSDGSRRTEVVSFDPEVDSLQSFSDKISAINGLGASVNQNSGHLNIFAAEGVKFDFTGRIETHPSVSSVSGTSIPSFSGVYVGDANKTVNFEIQGSGDIGLSQSLFLNVLDENGTLTRQINIGQGYEAGTDLEIDEGLSLSLSHGTVNAGDTFSTRLTSQPDETGILAALGLNSFFSGVNANTIEIDSQVLHDVTRLASGRSGDAADTVNLFNLTDVENAQVMSGGATLAEFADEINSEIGFQINTNTAISNSLESLRQRLEEERDAYSAVDLNEEIVYLQEYQKSFEASVRIIQTADEILEEVFRIVG